MLDFRYKEMPGNAYAFLLSKIYHLYSSQQYISTSHNSSEEKERADLVGPSNDTEHVAATVKENFPLQILRGNHDLSRGLFHVDDFLLPTHRLF